ncbi:serine/threonine-protein kinase PLK1 [Oncorhynchus keta]|uniref:serine/threonine-protein kinase PLK1 n=1 Tax=Oncorhynchus keta TaxID=8018 RepID=UPI00227D2772|nr:serine/threonine-protein kinase PLK1 [Oncorhynchus keta]
MSAPVTKAVNPSTTVDPKSAPLKDIPDVLVDPRTLKKYSRGRFLGKGGFAKCYEITDMETREVFAGKVVPKSMIVKPHQREKMSSEISIHKSLDNPHIVGFHGFFEDDDFVFVVLEICRRRSLLELHKRRKAVTEPEARYYMMQLVKGCQYLHNNRVIHRDLKLGNIFLSDDMDVKIGDFGLATKIEFDGERKKTLCGTPNYIAPEVLCKKGHSFEVDVWSLGCILYTLLVGKPPFVTDSTSQLHPCWVHSAANTTHYYTTPWQINPVAASLIKRMLHADPSQRPTVSQLLTDEFFTEGYIPLRLPTTCLTVPPRFSIAPSSLEPSQRRPLTALNNKGTEKVEQKDEPLLREIPEATDCHLSDLLQQLDTCNAAKPSERGLIRMEEAEDPACVPIFWISKWVDYTHGLPSPRREDSYAWVRHTHCQAPWQRTHRMATLCHHVTAKPSERTHTHVNHTMPSPRRVTMGNPVSPCQPCVTMSTLCHHVNPVSPCQPCVTMSYAWVETPVSPSEWRVQPCVTMSSPVRGLNAWDHTKLILCPLMGAVSFIDEKRDFRTYKTSLIEEFGCCKELASRMRYARLMVAKLLSCKSSTPH